MAERHEAPALPQLEWMVHRAATTLKFKPDAADAFVRAADAHKPLLDLIARPDVHHVFLTSDNPKDIKAHATAPPAQPQHVDRKVFWFLKPHKTALTLDNLAAEVVYGDLGGGTVDHLHRTLVDVTMPLLSNPANRRGLPEVLAREIVEAFHKLAASTAAFSTIPGSGSLAPSKIFCT